MRIILTSNDPLWSFYDTHITQMRDLCGLQAYKRFYSWKIRKITLIDIHQNTYV